MTDRLVTPLSSPIARWALVFLCLCSAVIFVIRGPVHGLKYADDFVLIYGPARVWLNGGNPYNVQQVDAAWTDAGLPDELRPSSLDMSALLYPPTTLPMFAPFAALPWRVAHPLWIGINVLFLMIVLHVAARFAGLVPSQPRCWVFIAAALLFTPLHTMFKTGQTPLYALAMIAAGFWLTRTAGAHNSSGSRGRNIASGLMLGCAALIKPQIGLPFLALQALRRQWIAVLSALGVVAVVAVVAIVPLTLNNHAWMEDWKGNLARFSEGSVGDPTALNHARHHLLNLHYPLHTFIENRTIVNVLVVGIVGGLAAWFFRLWILDFGLWLSRRAKQPATATFSIVNRPATADLRQSTIINPILLPLSMVAILTLMVAYHRYYDAVLLVFPLAWAISAIAARRTPCMAWGILFLMTPFFLNAATALKVMEQRVPFPAWILDQWWWNSLIMPMQAWALLGMAMLLIAANRKTRAAESEQTVTP